MLPIIRRTPGIRGGNMRGLVVLLSALALIGVLALVAGSPDESRSMIGKTCFTDAGEVLPCPSGRAIPTATPTRTP
jgi:hypothetical protein